MLNWEYYNEDGSPKKPSPRTTKKVVKKGKNDSSSAMDTVDGDDNIIYFYAGVTGKENFKLNHKISHLDREMQMVAVKLGMDTPPPIHLHINSYGGSVFAAFGSIDYIMSSKTPVYTYIDACAASAGTIMSVCGNRRFMGEHAYMLVHQLSSTHWGKYQELKDDMENSDKLMARIKEIYNQKTKIPKTKMDEILKHDLWWDAKTCLKYGLVDEIKTS
jgi:ATP-dependent protease ClpP protease subunit